MAFSKPPHLVTRRFLDKTFLVSNSKGESARTLLELNDTASFLWDHLESAKNQNDLAKQLEDEFEITTDQAKECVVNFLKDLSDSGVKVMGVTGYTEFSKQLHGEVYDQLARGKRIPLEGTIELTRLCSIKCTHCYIGDARWTKDPNELTTDEVKKIFDAMAERGTIWLCITGGEAMIRKDFRELWLYAKSKGFILTLFSNATLIDESMGQFLEDHPPFNLEISIYGATEETYERVSQVKGSFKRFLRGIDQLRKRQNSIPWKLKSVLIQDNAHELQLMKQLASDWGVVFNFDASINPSIGEGKTGGQAPCATRVGTDTMIDEYWQDSGRKEPLDDYVKKFETGEAPPGRPPEVYSCGAGTTSYYVNAKGDLQMCILTGHRGQSLRAKDTIEESFDVGWNNFGEFRKIKADPNSPCLTCDISNICENCAGFSYLENGDENKPVAYLCRSTHLKAHRLGIKHQCGPNHFVYDSVRNKKGANHERTNEIKKEKTSLRETRGQENPLGQ